MAETKTATKKAPAKKTSVKKVKTTAVKSGRKEENLICRFRINAFYSDRRACGSYRFSFESACFDR